MPENDPKARKISPGDPKSADPKVAVKAPEPNPAAPVRDAPAPPVVPAATVAPAPAAVDAPEGFHRDPRDARPARRAGRTRRDAMAEYRDAYRSLADRDPGAAARYPRPGAPGQNFDVETVLESIRALADGLTTVGPGESIRA